MIHGKINGAFQMFIYRALVLVSKGDNLVNKGKVSGFGNIFIYSRKQPQSIISPVCGMSCFLYIGCVIRRIFMSCIVGKFNQGQTASVIHLGRKHETNLQAVLLL